MTRAVYLVAGCRTPFLKVKNQRGPFKALDLALAASRQLLLQTHVLPNQIDEVILGCTMPTASEANIARLMALRLDCNVKIPAWTVQRNCGSGLQAITSGFDAIDSGRSDLVLAGGTEAMSHAPLLWRPHLVDWFARVRQTSWPKKLMTLASLNWRWLKPEIALLLGLTDPIIGLSMGQTAEYLATLFNIDRHTMDQFALQSHIKAKTAEPLLQQNQIIPLFDSLSGVIYQNDDGIRADSNLEQLAKLKPLFDPPYGQITAGNSSQVTDGAACVLLASGKIVKKYQLPILARIKDYQWVGVLPEQMGLGPIPAIAQLLERQKLTKDDIDFFEINEAFAAQVLACLKVMQDAHYFPDTSPIGAIDINRLNVQGGACAFGHPIAATGARLVLQLGSLLQQQKATRGIASLCVGGGQGGAILLERA